MGQFSVKISAIPGQVSLEINSAVIAGLLLGLLETMTVGYVSSLYRDLITFLILFVALVARPTGLFSAASRDARP